MKDVLPCDILQKVYIFGFPGNIKHGNSPECQENGCDSFFSILMTWKHIKCHSKLVLEC